jgi:hypothetical protein
MRYRKIYHRLVFCEKPDGSTYATWVKTLENTKAAARQDAEKAIGRNDEITHINPLAFTTTIPYFGDD